MQRKTTFNIGIFLAAFIVFNAISFVLDIPFFMAGVILVGMLVFVARKQGWANKVNKYRLQKLLPGHEQRQARKKRIAAEVDLLRTYATFNEERTSTQKVIYYQAQAEYLQTYQNSMQNANPIKSLEQTQAQLIKEGEHNGLQKIMQQGYRTAHTAIDQILRNTYNPKGEE